MSTPQTPTPPPDEGGDADRYYASGIIRPAARMDSRAARSVLPYTASYHAAMFVAVLFAVVAWRHTPGPDWSEVIGVLGGFVLADTFWMAWRRSRG